MKRTVGGGGKKVFRVPQESWRRLV
jgi:hypothetical protein